MNKTAGTRIDELLKIKGLSQSDLAKAIGVKPQAIQQWISGDTTPKEPNLKKAADYLSVTAEYLRYGDNKNIQSLEEIIAKHTNKPGVTLQRADLIEIAASLPEKLIPQAKRICKALVDPESDEKRPEKKGDKTE